MYASVTAGEIQPGKMDEYLSIYRGSVMPVISELPGVKHLFVLTDAETNKGMTVAIYETKDDAERTQNSGDYQKIIGMMIGTIVPESISRKGYEVSIHM